MVGKRWIISYCILVEIGSDYPQCHNGIPERGNIIFNQRVLGNTNPVKLGRCFSFLNNWYGLEHGGDRKSSDRNCHLKNDDDPKNQSELANMYGIARTTMNNYMRIAKAIPELEDLVDTGIVSKDTALVKTSCSYF